MLHIARRIGQGIVIKDSIGRRLRLRLVGVERVENRGGGSDYVVRFGVDGPREIEVYREELRKAGPKIGAASHRCEDSKESKFTVELKDGAIYVADESGFRRRFENIEEATDYMDFRSIERGLEPVKLHALQ